MRHDDSLATVLLVSRLCSDGQAPLKASEYWRLCDQVGTPSALLGRSVDELTSCGLPGELAGRVASLFDRATAMAFELERLGQSGIRVLTPFDEDFPARFVARLGAKAPPVLYAAGALGLLGHAGVGVVGSRDVEPEGAEVAKAAAGRAARRGLSLVSGGARGVDQLAMNAAFQAGGTVIGILADSLAKALRSPDVRRAIHDGATVLCTPYSPDSPFSAGNAMGRNKLVYAQSVVTLVVASDVDKGGTWSGAVEALKEGFGRVAVWRGPGEGRGNERLEGRGAVPVRTIDAFDDLLRDPAPAEPGGAGAAVQASLFAQPAPEEAAGPPSASDAGPGLSPAGEHGGGPGAGAVPAGGRAEGVATGPRPTGQCWCGCGAATGDGAFFVPGHANRAVARVINEAYGGYAAFLVAHGFAPGPADRGGEPTQT